jgi:hypothetical protein
MREDEKFCLTLRGDPAPADGRAWQANTATSNNNNADGFIVEQTTQVTNKNWLFLVGFPWNSPDLWAFTVTPDYLYYFSVSDHPE